MFFSRLPPPTEKMKRASFGLSLLTFSHSTKIGRPALVVGARGQFRNVVGRRIGFDADDLAEVVDRMAAIAGAAANSKKEDAAVFSFHLSKKVRHCLDRVDVYFAR